VGVRGKLKTLNKDWLTQRHSTDFLRKYVLRSKDSTGALNGIGGKAETYDANVAEDKTRKNGSPPRENTRNKRRGEVWSEAKKMIKKASLVRARWKSRGGAVSGRKGTIFGEGIGKNAVGLPTGGGGRAVEGKEEGCLFYLPGGNWTAPTPEQKAGTTMKRGRRSIIGPWEGRGTEGRQEIKAHNGQGTRGDWSGMNLASERDG